MALLLKKLIASYRYFNEEVADPRTQDWLFIGSPWSIAIILTFYVQFVQTLGPRLMKDRKPFKLDRIVQLYNISQIVLNAYLIYKATIAGWFKYTNFKCDPIDYSNSPRGITAADACWLFFIIKLTDLLDTLFFVLRKKQSQVSFLHVYHHAAMVLACWGLVKWIPGGHLTFIGMINAFVHIVMYTYYLLSSLKLTKLWWKKYLTQMQLLQFVLIILHFSQLLWRPDCHFPKWTTIVIIPQNMFMVILFGDFYYKAYVKKKSPPPVKLCENGTPLKDSKKQ